MRPGNGRTSQKARARQELLTTARRVMERGGPATVVATASEAGVSKATAYRSFSTSKALDVEIIPVSITAPSEEFGGGAQDVRERVLRMRRHLVDFTRNPGAKFRRSSARATETPGTGGGQARCEIKRRPRPPYEHALFFHEMIGTPRRKASALSTKGSNDRMLSDGRRIGPQAMAPLIAG